MANPPDAVVWTFDNLKSLGGHPITKVVGNPKVIDTPGGMAVQFDGADALFVGDQPIAGFARWTTEVVFRPDAAGGAAQRWFHMQAGGADRVLFELRQAGGTWFLVSFVQSGNATARAFAVGFPHPLGAWYHVAIVVDGVSLKHFVNGVYENAGPCPGAEGCQTTELLKTPYPLAYKPIGNGGTSLGCRYTQEAFLHGAIRMARFTPRALAPTEFLPVPAN
ncbi:MAG TPA: LamG domain-containing protein [Polyangia bacterium]|nr:LamG domain-containing protein [Polyangia bacterium]